MIRSPNFAAMLEGLLIAGHPARAIARETGISHATVLRIAAGEIKRPSYDTGAAILKFHERHPTREPMNAAALK